MYTYEDLVNVGTNDTSRALFCRKAIDEFMGSSEYLRAKEGEAYYAKHNTTIENYQKFLYTVSGRQVPDIFSANYKLKTTFFRRLVQQQVQYVLANGVTLQKPKNKEKLGQNFDFQMTKAAKKAMAAGRAFGFWNLDHLEVFGYADTPQEAGFCPLYSEADSKLRAGIRFWFRKIGDDVIFRATLYEEDGYTEYRQKEDTMPVVLEAKRAYKLTEKRSIADGVQEVIGENYTSLPIVCLYANDTHESELVGIRECVDCYDFIKSGLANSIDDLDGLYWIVENAGGMADKDLAVFIQRLKTLHAAVVNGDDGVKATPTSADVPVEARSRMLEILRADIYEDFQSLDVKTLSAAAKTTQEIQAAYQSQDNKCADFEYYILDFIQQILEIAGIDDEPTLNWNRVINQKEQTDMILSCANYLTEEALIKHLPFLTPEEADAIIEQNKEDDVNKFNEDDEDGNEDDEEDGKVTEDEDGDEEE